MLAPFFQGQRDFIFFVYGLAFLLLSALCLALHHQVAPRLPWLWLGLFGLIHGVNAWQELLAVSVGDSSAFTAIRLGVILVFDRVWPQRLASAWRSCAEPLALCALVSRCRSGGFGGTIRLECSQPLRPWSHRRKLVGTDVVPRFKN